MSGRQLCSLAFCIALNPQYFCLVQRYVDIILNLIRIAGDYVSEEVWYRVIQIVINRDDVQGRENAPKRISISKLYLHVMLRSINVL